MKQRKIIIDCDPGQKTHCADTTKRDRNANWIYQMDADGFFALLLERLDT